MFKQTWLILCIALCASYPAKATTIAPDQNNTILTTPDWTSLPDTQKSDLGLIVPPLTPETTTPIAVTPANEDENKKKDMAVTQLLTESKKYYTHKNFTKALSLLEQANIIMPNNYDVELTMAKVLSWKKDYTKAQHLLDQLIKKYPNNADIELIQGYLYYYQQQLVPAKNIFEKILAQNRKNTDAKTALSLVNKAISSTQKSKQKPTPVATKIVAPTPTAISQWRIDTGTEYSALYRTTLSNWNQEFLQVTHFSKDNATAINGRVDRYYQFNEVDTQYELGVNQKFKPWLNAYLYGIDTPGANFRPIWGLGGGGEMRFNQETVHGFNGWATVDVQDYIYTIGPATNLNPGIRVEYNDRWDLIVRNINQFQGNNSQSGWLVQTHAELMPGYRFNVGISQAPDIENLVTFTVKSIFTGVAIDITPAVTLHLEYIRDDYVNAYLRQAFNGTFTFKL